MKTITIENKTHNSLWLFKIKSKAKSLDDVIQIMLKVYRERLKQDKKDEWGEDYFRFPKGKGDIKT